VYRLRRGIESFFAQFKSRGLNFEAIPLRAGLGLERLCAVLAVAFVLPTSTAGTGRPGAQPQTKRTAIARKACFVAAWRTSSASSGGPTFSLWTGFSPLCSPSGRLLPLHVLSCRVEFFIGRLLSLGVLYNLGLLVSISFLMGYVIFGNSSGV
jgi:hypothetical protein